jgi:hypothetical protein
MRKNLTILIVCFMFSTFFCGCKGKKVVVMSLKGSSSTSSNIHTAVDVCSREYGIPLTEGQNWIKESGDGVAGNGDAERIRNKINDLVSWNGGDKSNLSLLVVGKSAGGVLAWNTFKRHYGDIDDFRRISLVLVDPHGAVWDDGQSGPYSDDQDLWWPDTWSHDTDFFRVYNVYQREEGLTGASFPGSRVYEDIQITEEGISHSNIPDNSITRELITDALTFAHIGN